MPLVEGFGKFWLFSVDFILIFSPSFTLSYFHTVIVILTYSILDIFNPRLLFPNFHILKLSHFIHRHLHTIYLPIYYLSIYFVLISFTYFCCPLIPFHSGDHLFVLCIYDSLSVLLGLFIYVVLLTPHIGEIIQYFSFSVGLISLSIITSMSIMFHMADLISYGYIILHCICMPQLLYPFILML